MWLLSLRGSAKSSDFFKHAVDSTKGTRITSWWFDATFITVTVALIFVSLCSWRHFNKSCATLGIHSHTQAPSNFLYSVLLCFTIEAE